MSRHSLNLESYQKLIQVSLREEPANIWLKNVQFLNVYLGKIERKNIVISGQRIAYVGDKEPLASRHTEIIELNEKQIIVPGYIEPHGHPFQLYNPITWSDFLLSGGTTTSINDNLFFFTMLGVDKSIKFIEELNRTSELLHLWWARFDDQTEANEIGTKRTFSFNEGYLGRWLDHPLVIQGGEFTSWSRFLKGDMDLAKLMLMTKQQYGKRIEGHLPGASLDTLNAMAASGVGADHESINGEDVLNRLSIGMYAALRHSSIRPDLPKILTYLIQEPNLNKSLLMLTSDGSHPFFLNQTGIDKMIKIMLDYGFNVIDVYRIATLNPATYYGLDQNIGSISPGRLAHLNVLEDLSKPTPLHVMVGGKWAIRNNTLLNKQGQSGDWLKSYFYKERIHPNINETHLSQGEGHTGIRFVNAVITVPYKYQPTQPLDEGELYLSLLDQQGKWVLNTRMKGFSSKLLALASSYTASKDYVLIGKNRDYMLKAFQEMLDLNGGIVAYFEDQECIKIPLPLSGGMSLEPLETVIKQTTFFVKKMNESGYRFKDPFFTLFFLTTTHLPNVRLTYDGLYLIKEEQIITPVSKL
ncbi:adenine deaminase C-terminal domain-containing protein [Pueribacillus sp. YX66]|uniref:adenine deaminase C-terminal domain-containing protein n=1 Tax=Pueribacillus sp. YX66 TaxID=3229242 RepID=UPI00358D83F4